MTLHILSPLRLPPLIKPPAGAQARDSLFRNQNPKDHSKLLPKLLFPVLVPPPFLLCPLTSPFTSSIPHMSTFSPSPHPQRGFYTTCSSPGSSHSPQSSFYGSGPLSSLSVHPLFLLGMLYSPHLLRTRLSAQLPTRQHHPTLERTISRAFVHKFR